MNVNIYSESESYCRVPTKLAESAVDAFASVGMHDQLDALNAILEQSSEQHQGEPVAFVRFRNGEPDYDGDACMIMNVPGDTLGDGDSWEPLYTHADPTEVERLRAELAETQRISHEEELRANRYSAQLAEAQALLRFAEAQLTNLQPHIEQSCYPGRAAFIDNYVDPVLERIRALSSGAEPSAPTDTDRLDHIARHGYSVSCRWLNTGFCGPKGREWDVYQYGSNVSSEAETLREAIDLSIAARAALEKKS